MTKNEASSADDKAEFLQQLRNTYAQIGKLLDCAAYEEYWESLTHLPHAHQQIGKLLGDKAP